MPDSLVSVANVTIERGGRQVLSRLSFDLAAGEIILISGRNGAGKSTLLRTVAGLLQPMVGRIAYGRATSEVRGVETVHYVGYEDALKPSLTVGENLAFWASMLGGPSRSATALDVAGALGAFGIGRLIDLRAGYLSAGQKRRVALARLLLAPRPIWLLDEPLIALDREAQDRLTALMSDHVAAASGIIVASHQPLTIAFREIDLSALAGAEPTVPLSARSTAA